MDNPISKENDAKEDRSKEEAEVAPAVTINLIIIPRSKSWIYWSSMYLNVFGARMTS